jgi:integrase
MTRHKRDGLRKRCTCKRTLERWKACPHPWHANYSFNGTEYRVSLHKWAKKPADYVMQYGEAKSVFGRWKVAIEDGAVKPARVEKLETITLDTIAKVYTDEHVNHPDRRTGARKEMQRQVDQICASMVDVLGNGNATRLGSMPAASISKAVIEAFRQNRRQAHEAAKDALARVQAMTEAGEEIPGDLRDLARMARSSGKTGRVATNRLLTRLRHLFAWAIAEKGLLEATPFTKGGVSVIKIDSKAEAPRSRRMEGDEEPRLLAAAGPHLRACIEAALETGMRKGEILGVQWQHVKTDAGIIDVPADIAKTGTARQVVITPRLAAILEMRETEQRKALELAEDASLPPLAHPFGNDIGEPVKDVKTAWRLTCRRAGITGLHFHDLRREAGSRLLETPGVNVTDVRDFLGHTSVTMTNTYLATTTLRLREALKKRDSRTNLAHAPEQHNSRSDVAAVTH